MLIAIGAAVLLLIGGGAFFFLSANRGQKVADQSQQQEVIPTLAPDAIGLTLEAIRNNQAIHMSVTKLSGITSIDYEVNYTAKGDIPRGVIGHIDVTPNDTTKSQDVVLGTCSNVCHYDEDVHDIKFTLKVAKTDGKVYQVEQGITL